MKLTFTPMRFPQTPHGFWKILKHHRQFFDWLANEANIKTQEDWYHLNQEYLNKHKVSRALESHNKSLITALSRIYPELQWKPWKFNKVPVGYWNYMTSRRHFMDSLSQQLKLRNKNDWYKLTSSIIYKQGGKKILNHVFRGSLHEALREVYPECDWVPWQFSQVPKGYWNSVKNRTYFFDWVAHQLDIKTFKDWYRVSKLDILECGSGGLLHSHYGDSHVRALLSIYPKCSWEVWR